MKSDISKRADKAKIQDVKFREMPDIVVKVVCRYRAELFFKISRKTKLSRLFNAWTERMETGAVPGAGMGLMGKKDDAGGVKGVMGAQANGTAKTDAASATSNSGSNSGSPSSPPSPSPSSSSQSMQFIFTHSGRSVDSDQTPEEAGMEDGDEILAVELMDLTEGTGVGAGNGNREGEGKGQEWEELIEPRRQKLKKNWTDNPKE